MIKNERQYRITRTQAERFAQTLRSLRERPEAVDGVHPMDCASTGGCGQQSAGRPGSRVA